MISNLLIRTEFEYFCALPRILKVIGWIYLVFLLAGLVIVTLLAPVNLLPYLGATVLNLTTALCAILLGWSIANRNPLTVILVVIFLVSASSQLISPDQVLRGITGPAALRPVLYGVYVLEVLAGLVFLAFTIFLWWRGKFTALDARS